MTHFFERRDRWGNGMALWVLVVMAALVPPAWWAIQQIHLENNVENWLSEDDPDARVLAWTRRQFPLEDRVYISWDGSSLADPRVEEFAGRLQGTPDAEGVRRGGLESVDSVAVPTDAVLRIAESGIEPEEAVRRLTGLLIGTGRLRMRLTAAGRNRRAATIEQLVAAADRELGLTLEVSDPRPVEEVLLEPATPVDGPDADADASDEAEAPAPGEPIVVPPVVLTADTLELVPGDTGEHHLQVRWQGMQSGSPLAGDVARLARSLRGPRTDADPQGVPLVESAFYLAGSPVALSITLSEAGLAEKSKTLETLYRVAAEVGIPRADLHMGGGVVAGTELNQDVKKAGWNPEAPLWQIHKRSVLLLTVVVGAVLSFVMLRSLRLATLVLLVAVFTVWLSVALVPVTGGSMNMVLIVMPTLLMVLTISAAIHVANYWKHAAGRDPRTAIVAASDMAWQPCALAGVTTAIGLVSLASSTLVPVRDFGMYSAVGTLLSVAVVLYGLPSLLQFWPAKTPRREQIDHGGWRRLGHFLARYNLPVAAACLLLAAGATYGLRWFTTEIKVVRYFPDDSKIVQDYRFLEENLTGIVPVELVVRFDEGAQERTTFLERMELVRDLGEKVRAHPEISGAISLADFRPVAEPAPPADAPRLARARYARRSMETEQRIKEDPAGAASAFFAVAQQSHDWLEPGDAGLNKEGDELWRITAQVAVMSDLDYDDLTHELDGMARSVLKYEAGAHHFVTGTVPLFLRTQMAVLNSLIRSFCLAFAVIAVVMMALLKNPLAGLAAMLPNVLPVAIVFGMLSWFGVRVDIGTMITASVALGIAVDGTLHLLTWFQSGIRGGMSRQEAVAHALEHCGPAMWQTSTVVGIGMLMLWPAELLLISRFGWLMGSIVAAALLGDLVLLPALLAGPLGKLFERSAIIAPPAEPAERSEGPRGPHLSLAGSRERGDVD